VLRLVLRFRSAFWEQLDGGRYRDAGFFQSADSAFPTFWTQLPAHAPFLVAWAGGPHAMRLANADLAARVRHATAGLRSFFGGRLDVESQLEAAWLHDWQRDPYARGAYSWVKVGGGRARRSLAAPLQNTLFFAGEATDYEGEAATVAGALQSGLRAAREILESDS
jgi:monoamine oxidase